jgi:hypothetical protein
LSPSDEQAPAGGSSGESGPRTPNLDFTTFVLSLSQAALQQLGCSGCDQDGQPGKVNLGLAQQTIDVLAMLQEKTRGNLTPTEEKLLGSLLYDLRMRYVECAQAPPK